MTWRIRKLRKECIVVTQPNRNSYRDLEKQKVTDCNSVNLSNRDSYRALAKIKKNDNEMQSFFPIETAIVSWRSRRWRNNALSLSNQNINEQTGVPHSPDLKATRQWALSWNRGRTEHDARLSCESNSRRGKDHERFISLVQGGWATRKPFCPLHCKKILIKKCKMSVHISSVRDGGHWNMW